MLRPLALLIATLLTGCGTMNAARPLPADKKQVGVNFGGPFTTSLGPPVPIPNLVVDCAKGVQFLNEIKDHVVNAFTRGIASEHRNL